MTLFAVRRRILALAAILLFFLYYRQSATLQGILEPSSSSRRLHVSLINAPRYHFEVVLPLLHALAPQRAISTLSLVATASSASRFGMWPFLEDSFVDSGRAPFLREPDSIYADADYAPDVMVLVSCMHDLRDEAAVHSGVERVLQQKPSAMVVCVLHEVKEWRDPQSRHRRFISKWAKEGRLKFLVLSDHVRRSLSRKLNEWGLEGDLVLPVFVPVFRLGDDKLSLGANNPPQKSISIPGKYEPWRRSYGPIFASMSRHSSALHSINASLHLVGFGKHPSPIPTNVRDMVFFHDQLDFGEYWRTLRETLAIATAFAHDHYIKDQASSTIATALIVGVPLICAKEVLEAYTYLTEDVVWGLKEGESVVEGFLRVLGKGEGAWEEKRRAVDRSREYWENENRRWIGRFLEGVAEEEEIR